MYINLATGPLHLPGKVPSSLCQGPHHSVGQEIVEFDNCRGRDRPDQPPGPVNEVQKVNDMSQWNNVDDGKLKLFFTRQSVDDMVRNISANGEI